MIIKESSITSESTTTSATTAPRSKRDIASPVIAIGGVISAIAAQRVGELPIRVFSTTTGLLAAGLGSSAWVVGRKADAAEKAAAAIAAQATVVPQAATNPQVITLPVEAASTQTDDLTVVVDLNTPAVIDLSATADETVTAS